MDPLITNGVEPALLHGMEKGDAGREPETRRKRPQAADRRDRDREGDESQIELGFDPPQHSLDDLA